MKNIILFTPIFLMLVSCGPSQEEKEEIAVLTCNIMGESRNMDSSFRIKEINAARKDIGEDKYLGSDEGIKESFKYGLCKELVLNDPEYRDNLTLFQIREMKKEEKKKKIVRERIEKEQEAAFKIFSKACSNKIDKNLLLAGYKTYQNNCVACHQQNGEGIPPVFPALSNLSITSDEYIEIMLNGIQGTAMMPYALLSDKEIAAVISFNQNCWENEGEIVDPNEILNLRK